LKEKRVQKWQEEKKLGKVERKGSGVPLGPTGRL
jgi:hypothetical protein